ncbi:glycosyltransferase family 2 protein [Haloarcula nitratireducens]|uniref:Glycosyltransferase family 2 protein n=1 Tax=Haloarcula nitratireducens TaxID=2487749 RepID=A0AAW4PCY9_9EURY|nr:glycosyltransferase family 2 protein [Halomicroarcula nitratireducens]MBX0295755.1 glycosyltransferase family 2 protein [Halomicroarcula nitratireducens]
MYQGKTIAAVVPAYNEEGLIGEVIDTLPEYVDQTYVVDDGSTDGTWAEIQEHAEQVNDRDRTADSPPATDGGVEADRRVVPIQHEENTGVGGAIKTGYKRALDDEMDVTVVISGDGQTEPDIVQRILEPVADGRADYSKGNRLLDRDRSDMPAFRQLGNFMLSFLSKVASGYWSVMDPQNGSTAISLEALEQLDLDELYDGYGFVNDLLVRLNANNMRIADVARRAVYKDETSHISYRSFIPQLSLLLLKGFLWRLRSKYLVKDFHPLAFLYYLGAFAVGTGGLLLLGRASDTGEGAGVGETLVLGVLGIMCLVMAMIFDREENRNLQIREDGRDA